MADDELPNGGLFEHLETVRQRGFADWLRPPLHERIEAYLNEIDPRRRGCSADFAGRTPGERRGVSPSSVRMKWLYEDDGFAAVPDDSSYKAFGPDVTVSDFGVTIHRDVDTEDDLLDAARMFIGSHKPSGIYESGEVERGQADWDEVDWEKAAEDLKRHGPDDLLDEVYIHPAVFPGDARSLAEAEALVGTHPKHETLEEMPGPCIMCGEDEVRVTVQRNPDGEIEETDLKCHECGWRVTGGPVRFEEADRLDRPDGEVDWNP